MTTRLLVDTCVWLDLAKDFREEPIIAALEQATRNGVIALVAPAVVVDEYLRSKDRVIGQATDTLKSHLRVVRDAVTRFGSGEADKDATLAGLAEIDRTAFLKGEAVVHAFDRVEALLRAATPMSLTEAVKVRLAERALSRRAPFHTGKLSVRDAVLVECFTDLLASAAPDDQVGFVTHNFRDFGPDHGDRREPHPDLASMFDGTGSRYFASMIEAVRWAAPDALEDYDFELEASMEPRRLSEILEAEHTLFRQVWYNRHWNYRSEIEAGKVKVVRDSEWTAERNQSTIIQSVWRNALATAKRTEEELGEDNLGPWSDFEWGVLNGKLSALRWVMGDDWDMLDT